MSKYNIFSRRNNRNDIILIGAILLIAVVGLVYLFLFRGRGDTVKVTVDGKAYASYSLSEDRVEDIHTGESSEQLNRLVIRNGKAFVETATCRDGICSSHRPIFRDGESIVCLPNRVVITVISDKTSDAPDAVA
ncbi:MAG: NusG domain II-containing protein [Clostridia bacterium]|nr:NusG domain II-containing protein [Clostridia bacterium]